MLEDMWTEKLSFWLERKFSAVILCYQASLDISFGWFVSLKYIMIGLDPKCI